MEKNVKLHDEDNKILVEVSIAVVQVQFSFSEMMANLPLLQ
jgi:hypothetical protein